MHHHPKLHGKGVMDSTVNSPADSYPYGLIAIVHVVQPVSHNVIASNVTIEWRTPMSQANDSSSAPFKSPPTSSEIHALIGAATQSTIVAPEDDQTVDRCVQDIDPSHASTASHLGDCNLECCTCAVRWSGRRTQLEREA